MRIHYLQHVPFENLAGMEVQLRQRGHSLKSTKLYEEVCFPSCDEFDWLIVMGGPMGVHDDADYTWLRGEKKFISDAIHRKKVVLGVCLGAQLIADVLGAKVFPNRHREIGWFEIERNECALQTPMGDIWPEKMEVFHWHGDTFEVPQGAIPLARSKACENQAFFYGDRVLGLQFHLETTKDSAMALLKHCSDELDGSSFVQTQDEIMGREKRFTAINELMAKILDVLQDSGPF